MITIIYSTHKEEEYNDNFKRHLIQTAGINDIQILEYLNNNEYPLSVLYNKGINESTYDIVVCCHNDIKLEKGWGKKLLEDFNNNPDYGIIGKAGSCYFPKSGIYWERLHQTMVGQVYHQPKGQKKFLSKYSPKLPFLISVVTIDGLFMSFNKTKIKHEFDETIGKFHFYDHGFCIPNFLDGVKIGVTSSFEITHESIGQPNEEFYTSKDVFIEKYKSVLPLNLPPDKLYVPEIKEKLIKNVGKVAVIIPTKGKVNMLLDCVNSFYEHCNPSLFNIFIADTGSTDEEKSEIKLAIQERNNINFIEYDYYNFAKINNDVVKNHVNNEYEFLLFCNNDIKLMNNAIYRMVSIFKDFKKVGTVGGRLHYGDNTVQHNGIVLYVDKNSRLQLTHKYLKNYFNYSVSITKEPGNTGGLLMIRRSIFERCGFFNESYVECFEDVELNMKCVTLGLTNYCDGNIVAYHYESQTRDEVGDKIDKMNEDYSERLLPFLMNNRDKLSHCILTHR